MKGKCSESGLDIPGPVQYSGFLEMIFFFSRSLHTAYIVHPLSLLGEAAWSRPEGRIRRRGVGLHNRNPESRELKLIAQSCCRMEGGGLPAPLSVAAACWFNNGVLSSLCTGI